MWALVLLVAAAVAGALDADQSLARARAPVPRGELPHVAAIRIFAI